MRLINFQLWLSNMTKTFAFADISDLSDSWHATKNPLLTLILFSIWKQNQGIKETMSVSRVRYCNWMLSYQGLINWAHGDKYAPNMHTKKLLCGVGCNGYHCCTTSFNKAWTQVLHRFKSCSQYVRASWWWASLTIVLVGNKAKRFIVSQYTTKTIHHQHHQIMCT